MTEKSDTQALHHAYIRDQSQSGPKQRRFSALITGETPNSCKLKIMSSTLRLCTVRVVDSVKLEHVQIMQGEKRERTATGHLYLKQNPLAGKKS